MGCFLLTLLALCAHAGSASNALPHGTALGTPCLQIQKLLLGFPKDSRGYIYMLSSLLVAFALGLLIYGVPVWTM